ncbi:MULTISPECIES: hypothetical protein [unclassified Bacillus (in: firmicutes)]|nr:MULTISPECIES: hypothetical protein [unclassified Bacillus (in: firmicutes)]
MGRSMYTSAAEIPDPSLALTIVILLDHVVRIKAFLHPPKFQRI